MSTQRIGWSKLSKAWSDHFVVNGQNHSTVEAALARTMPLLEDPTAVPFVCRYRQDFITPLSTKMIHQLAEYLQTHRSLESLRKRILEKLPANDEVVKLRVETSLSKSELEDLYAPYKPPAKGSLEDRIKKEHPGLVDAINAFWAGDESMALFEFRPVADAVILLANRIAGHPETIDLCLAYTHQWCRVKVSKKASNNHERDDDNFKTYHGFDNLVNRLRDHQVLAIRRGVDKGALKLSFEIDSDRAEGIIRRSLGNLTGVHYHAVWKDAIHDAWSRLLRKRCTTRAWKSAMTTADERAIEVFCENLRKALLAPPASPSTAVLGLDPGFKAGIKAAILDSNGQPLPVKNALTTVSFIGNHDKGVAQMVELLKTLREHQKSDEKLVVALGNGHGTQEARKLVRDASDSSKIPINVYVVNEAGASVWSVTEAANREFPDEQPASIAAVSIARRYQNPLPELVKIPPRSLGLGMYQHDFSENILDDKLHITSVDAVAEVGVDANACSLEILEKVPGMTRKLSERIIQARPLQSRNELLNITGLGPKIFENCAAFIRVHGTEELDQTLCHPESYGLARYILKKLKWDLNDSSSVGSLPTEKDRASHFKELITKAARRNDVSEERVLSVMDHLIRSILNPDPRLGGENGSKNPTAIGSDKGCSILASHLVTFEALRNSCPIRDVLGHVRNIVDFGVFVDFGGESDGLIHRSKLGRVPLDSLLVGQQIGVDILGVSTNNKVTLSLTGLGLPADNLDKHQSPSENVMQNNKRKPASSNGSQAKRPRTTSK